MINPEKLCMGCMNAGSGEKVCPVCGYDSSSSNPTGALPTKFVLNDRYTVGKLLSSNGEGITYIGWDNADDSIVKIKEYFPVGIAHRNPDRTVSVIGGHEYRFNEGLMEFMEINRLISKANFPALIPVLSVFEENGTVYSISRNISGITLENFLNRNGGTLKWEQARALFLPLIDTVKAMNDARIIHRGISAETVIVSRDGKLYLNDYSIKSLRILSSGFQNEIFDGYAAIEQYSADDIHTDDYTDVYGLCATLFRVLIGNIPPKATDRINRDVMSIPARFAEELPRHVLASLANGLQVLPQNRTKDIETLKNELVYGEIKTAPVKKGADKNGEEIEKPVKGSSTKYVIISAVATAVVFALLAVVLVFGVFKNKIFKDEPIISDDTSYQAPTVSKIGDIDSGAEVTSRLYDVPDLKGKYYADLLEDDSLEMFEFEITDKKFSDEYPKGTVCEQSIQPGGTGVVRDTKVELVISLGSKEIAVPSLKGMTEDEAKLELLKAGFLFENIKVIEKYDVEEKSGVIIDQSPKQGEKISTEAVVKIYINTYDGNTDSDGESGQD